MAPVNSSDSVNELFFYTNPFCLCNRLMEANDSLCRGLRKGAEKLYSRLREVILMRRFMCSEAACVVGGLRL